MSFDKAGHQLTLFPLQPSAADDVATLIKEMDLCKENHILFFNQ